MLRELFLYTMRAPLINIFWEINEILCYERQSLVFGLLRYENVERCQG